MSEIESVRKAIHQWFVVTGGHCPQGIKLHPSRAARIMSEDGLTFQGIMVSVDEALGLDEIMFWRDLGAQTVTDGYGFYCTPEERPQLEADDPALELFVDQSGWVSNNDRFGLPSPADIDRFMAQRRALKAKRASQTNFTEGQAPLAPLSESPHGDFYENIRALKPGESLSVPLPRKSGGQQ